jgi:hypothetical protein
MSCMKQVNVNVTPAMEQDLRQYMKTNGLTTKSEAIRRALHEAVKQGGAAACDYRSWLGLGLRAPLRHKPQFKNEDELWS